MLKLIIAAATIMLPGAALAEDWGRFYAEVYGGVALPSEAQFDTQSYDIDATWLAGAAFGIETPVPGFSLGVDVMRSGDAQFATEDCCTITSFSVMAEGEYALALNDSMAVYGSLGLGAINVAFAGDGEGDAWGAGYSAALGVRTEISDGVAVFAELKHTDTFDPVQIESTEVDTSNTAVLAGLRLSF